MLHTLLSIAQPFLGVLFWLQSSAPAPSPPRLQFQLRHAHALHDGHRVIFSDYDKNSNALGPLFEETVFSLKTRNITTYTPPSYAAIAEARRLSIHAMQSPDFRWDEEDVVGPNTEDRETLLLMAKMSNNAYYKPTDAEWYDLGPAWNGVRLLFLHTNFPYSLFP
jgi:lipase ATG15